METEKGVPHESVAGHAVPHRGGEWHLQQTESQIHFSYSDDKSHWALRRTHGTVSSMPSRPSRKKVSAPAKAAGPQDIQSQTDRRTAEQHRERTVRNLIGKFQGRKSI